MSVYQWYLPKLQPQISWYLWVYELSWGSTIQYLLEFDCILKRTPSQGGLSGY